MNVGIFSVLEPDHLLGLPANLTRMLQEPLIYLSQVLILPSVFYYREFCFDCKNQYGRPTLRVLISQQGCKTQDLRNAKLDLI